jgi:hypothetical protein
MINFVVSWWRSYQFRQAIEQENVVKAKQLLQESERSRYRLSSLEKLFKKQLQSEESLALYKQEVESLAKKLKSFSLNLDNLEVDRKFIDDIYRQFKIIECDRAKWQCTGIAEKVFEDLELELIDFLKIEFNKYSSEKLTSELALAIEDLEGLKHGIDPKYNFNLSPHVYLIKYFLENIYCTYLAWFVIYQAGFMNKNLKILDIAAGPGTVAYGLALFLQSLGNFSVMPQTHISYYSLEQQSSLQYRGLQFWRRYIESQPKSINAYFRFDTADLFDYKNYAAKLPKSFFDFIIISHCFFYDRQQRKEAHHIYQKFFRDRLTPDGYILLIVQGRKLFSMYDTEPSEDLDKERYVIDTFLNELGVKLEFYKYLTSTGKRTPLDKNLFTKFARENLPKQKYMSELAKKHLGQRWSSNYKIDDYIILARL